MANQSLMHVPLLKITEPYSGRYHFPFSGYWTALNREISGQKHHYFINVCQALIESPPACPKNAIAACQVDYNAKTQKGKIMCNLYFSQ